MSRKGDHKVLRKLGLIFLPVDAGTKFLLVSRSDSRIDIEISDNEPDSLWLLYNLLNMAFALRAKWGHETQLQESLN